jgi:transcriptional regulator with XRE-family HTH domain
VSHEQPVITDEIESAGDRSESGSLSLGDRLASLRNDHGYSMRELGRLANVSASLISEVERGRSEPSISVLKRLAEALGTTLTHFFSEVSNASGRVIRNTERRTLGKDEVVDSPFGVRFELASPDEAEFLEAIIGIYSEDASMGDEPVTHQGEEWGMVLEGRFKVTLGDEIYFLETGDSIWFRSTTPHRIENIYAGTSRYIWVDTPKTF